MSPLAAAKPRKSMEKHLEAQQKASGCCTEAIGTGRELPHSDVGCNRQCKDGVFWIEACDGR